MKITLFTLLWLGVLALLASQCQSTCEDRGGDTVYDCHTYWDEHMHPHTQCNARCVED